MTEKFYKFVDGVRSEITPEELEQFRASLPDPRVVAAEMVRNQRNQLLAQSDWTQLADATVDKAAWAAYRAALRAIPQQVGFPDNVQWPVQPA
jgi:hypothetical protein